MTVVPHFKEKVMRGEMFRISFPERPTVDVLLSYAKDKEAGRLPSYLVLSRRDYLKLEDSARESDVTDSQGVKIYSDPYQKDGQIWVSWPEVK
jgi:hypothetical protein